MYDEYYQTNGRYSPTLACKSNMVVPTPKISGPFFQFLNATMFETRTTTECFQFIVATNLDSDVLKMDQKHPKTRLTGGWFGPTQSWIAM
jgi:hypothetical protein